MKTLYSRGAIRLEDDMDKIKALSLIAMAIILVVAGYSLLGNQALALRSNAAEAVKTINEIQAITNKTIKDPGSRAQIGSKMGRLEAQINSPENKKSDNTAPDRTGVYIKLLFSLLFGGAALYVVLSQKYDDETRKWAFSVLSLLAGVWIGTAT
jgi:hypothetical protein